MLVALHHRERRVAEDLRDHPHGHAGGEQDRRCRVAQVVEAEVLWAVRKPPSGDLGPATGLNGKSGSAGPYAALTTTFTPLTQQGGVLSAAKTSAWVRGKLA